MIQNMLDNKQILEDFEHLTLYSYEYITIEDFLTKDLRLPPSFYIFIDIKHVELWGIDSFIRISNKFDPNMSFNYRPCGILIKPEMTHLFKKFLINDVRHPLLDNILFYNFLEGAR